VLHAPHKQVCCKAMPKLRSTEYTFVHRSVQFSPVTVNRKAASLRTLGVASWSGDCRVQHRNSNMNTRELNYANTVHAAAFSSLVYQQCKLVWQLMVCLFVCQ